MKHSWTALCWAVLALGLIIACTRKPQPTKPGPAPEKVYGTKTELADAGQGRDLYEMGFKPAITFAPVYFGLNKQAPTAESIEVLHTLVSETPKYSACSIEGHACPLGETNYNQALAYHRAQTVLSYLRAAGVRTGFQVTSYGEERPVTEDPSSYAMNRRVIVECTR